MVPSPGTLVSPHDVDYDFAGVAGLSGPVLGP
jgi:hypothetical protein